LLKGLDISTIEKMKKLNENFSSEIKQQEYVIAEEKMKHDKYQVNRL